MPQGLSATAQGSPLGPWGQLVVPQLLPAVVFSSIQYPWAGIIMMAYPQHSPQSRSMNSAMPDAIMADEEPVSYSRRGRRICLPARFQMTPCQVKTHVSMCADVWKIRCRWCAAAVHLPCWHSTVDCASLILSICDFALINIDISLMWCAHVPQLWRQ